MGTEIRPLQSSDEIKGLLAQLYSFLAQFGLPDITTVCAEISTPPKVIDGLVNVLYTLMDGGACFDTILVGVYSPFEPHSNLTSAWAWLLSYIIKRRIIFYLYIFHTINAYIKYVMNKICSFLLFPEM